MFPLLKLPSVRKSQICKYHALSIFWLWPKLLNLSHRCVCWIQGMGKDKFHSQNSFIVVSGVTVYVWNGSWPISSTAPPLDWSELNCTPHSKSPCSCVEEMCVEHHSILQPLLSIVGWDIPSGHDLCCPNQQPHSLSQRWNHQMYMPFVIHFADWSTGLCFSLDWDSSLDLLSVWSPTDAVKCRASGCSVFDIQKAHIPNIEQKEKGAKTSDFWK